MPAWILTGVLLGTAYAVLFHLWRGGSLRRLAALIAAAWLGFAAGQLVGTLIGWPTPMLGETHLIEATIGSLIALIVVSRPAA